MPFNRFIWSVVALIEPRQVPQWEFDCEDMSLNCPSLGRLGVTLESFAIRLRKSGGGGGTKERTN